MSGAPVLAQWQHCVAVVPVDGTEWADNYPLPLSLRRNLVLLVKSAMIETGEYRLEAREALDGIFTQALNLAVEKAQKRLGQEATGCITWQLVEAYE